MKKKVLDEIGSQTFVIVRWWDFVFLLIMKNYLEVLLMVWNLFLYWYSRPQYEGEYEGVVILLELATLTNEPKK